MKLREIGEDQLLGQLLPDLPLAKAVVRGPGDDCAVVKTRDRRSFLVLKTDCVVAGVHFLATANARDVGWKAMMRPLSLSRTVPGREAVQSQHSRRRNEQHTRPRGDFG